MFFQRYKSLVTNLALVFMLLGSYKYQSEPAILYNKQVAIGGNGSSSQRTPVTFTVTKTVDTSDGVCDSDCSLREAITVAEDGDRIDFAVDGTLVLDSGLPVIDKTITIDAGRHSIAIDGAGSYQIFQVAATGYLILDHLTLQNGRGSLCVDSDSYTCGGAIYNVLGNLTITNSTFSGNSARGGGAIFMDNGVADIINSTFSGNSGTYGGGILNWTGTVNVSNSTFFGNSASYGGAIYNDVGFLTLVNSTLSGNSGDYGSLHNEAGGISITNSILANSVSGSDCFNYGEYAGISVNANNLIETNAASPDNCGTPALATDPLLGPLANHGGATQTMELLPGSPAIDAANDASCPATDQRGVTRPQGAHCDIGAYEFEGSDAKNLVLNPGFENQGNSASDAANWIEGTNHVRASDKFHTGGWALHSTFRGAGTDTRTAAPIAVSANTTYTYSGYIWRANSVGGACLDMNDLAGERQLCTSASGSWQYLTGTWSSGSNTSVTLRLITDASPTGDIWFDDISLVGPGGLLTDTPMPTNTPTRISTNTPTITPTSPTANDYGWNLILNPGFETAGTSAADASNWVEGTNHARASDKFHTGGWALHSTYRGAGTDTHIAVPIEVFPYRDYIYSGYIWRANSVGGACMDMNDIAGEKQLCTSISGSWQYVSGTWNSGATRNVILRLITDGSPTGDIWFDDISFWGPGVPPTTPTTSTPIPSTATPTSTETLTPTRTNTPSVTPPNPSLVLNPSFETQGNSVSDAANWTEGTNHVRASDKFHTGGWALHSTFRGVGTDTYTTVPIAVSPNTTYTYSGYIWRANSVGGACLDMNDIPGERQLCTATAGRWQFLSGSWDSGSNTSVTLRLITDASPTGDIWFDDISLR